MRRHTPQLTFILLWVAIVMLCMQPIAQAATCIPALPYHVYIPSIVSESSIPMGNLFILRPEATTNMLVNPSGELATTNFTAQGGSIARSTTQQKRGAYSIAVTPTSGNADGVYYGTVSLTNGQTYTFSVDVLGALGVPYRIFFATTGAAALGTPTTFTGTGAWQRVEATYTEVSTTTRRLYVAKVGSSSTAVFYVDGLQLENLAYSTSYCDGDTKGCVWTGGSHISTSTRSSQVRSGGRKIDLTSISAYLVSQQGTGMPVVANQTTPYSIIDGSFLGRQSVAERLFTIAVSTSGNGTAAWHMNRQALIDLVKPDLVYPQQPFVLIYDGGGKELLISCVYDGGLEMADGKQEIETIAIRCLAVDPYWRVDGNDGVALTVQQSVSSANSIVRRSSAGVWSALGSGVTGGSAQVFAIAQGLDGTIYAGGSFTDAGGSGADYLAAYNPNTGAWSTLGSATAINNTVRALAIGPDGRLYAGGDFSSAGGVANTAGVAVWNGSAWAALATGSQAGVWALAFAPNGTLYVGGTFGNQGGTGADNLASWNGTAWSVVDTATALNDVVESLAYGNGVLYVGGNFLNAGGNANADRIATWNGTAWGALGTGANSDVLSLAVALDGTVYAAGNFTTIGGIASPYVAAWNGATWSAMGSGVGAVARSIGVTNDNTVYIGGAFTSAGGLTLPDRFAKWNGSVWTPADIDLPGTATVHSIRAVSDGSLYIGYDTAGTATSGVITLVTNTGSAKAYPRIVIKGPSSGTSRIYQISNITTGKAIYLNYTINSGETAILDLTPGRISFVSDFQGNIMGTVWSGSTLADFSLIPGVNAISFFAAAATVTATMTWEERCWSADSSGI